MQPAETNKAPAVLMGSQSRKKIINKLLDDLEESLKLICHAVVERGLTAEVV
ncbi:O-acyltransferase WSD1-like [Pyrus ussuriensis x Pyrus communis]|uniref:O-acyltransferase WSD1-like n=1 Tax=Pyrus ussuriensis x Pyrus communis TaxID=2448454 RepID=A0A5N5F6Z8_9ROSA|nr:O-acyltransferase WSD1-like [Pyrus ussuriensis x Pyrus communis]